MSLHQNTGFTVIELLVGLAIVCLLFGMAMPPTQALIERSKAKASVNWIVSSVAFTRYSAINKRTFVTLCPSKNGYSCGGQWHHGSIAFSDHNADRIINTNDELLTRFLPPNPKGTIKWRSFRNRQYLQMTPTGMTNYQNGNFVYCSEAQDPRFSRQVIINRPGRTRLARDSNGDGRVEDRRGKALRC